MMELFKKYYASLTTFVVFLVYYSTMAPSVLQIDTGELAAAQALLGIAHPTGYPLFTMLGYLFSLIPMPFTTIYQLNLFAALTTSAGIYFFIKTVAFILENFAAFEKTSGSRKSKKQQPLKRGKAAKATDSSFSPPQADHSAAGGSAITLLSLSGGLILAFSKTVWFQSTSVEVYSLHLALISAAFYTLVRAFVGSQELKNSRTQELKNSRTQVPENPGNESSPLAPPQADRYSPLITGNTPWLLFAIVLALSFSNHMTTLLIIPATAYLYFVRFGFRKESFITLGKMLGLFFTVLILIYAYMPIRAGMDPLINWGNPVDWERIMRHVSGKQYQVWLFSSSEAAAKNFARFFSGLPTEFYISLLASVLGIFYLMGRSTKLLVTALLLVFGTVFYAINYDIVDLESYFLLAYIGLSLLAVFGLLFLHEKLNDIKKTAGVAALLVLVQAGVTYGGINQSNNLIFEQYTKAVLEKSPKNAVLFSYQWDYWLSASYYFQFVEGLRKDVAVIDKELLRRSWYYNQLDNKYPWLTPTYKKEADVFLKEVVPFERELPYAAQVIEGAYRDVMLAMLLNNMKDKAVFIGPEVFEKEIANKEIVLPDSVRLVPHLFFYQLTSGDQYVPAPDPDFTLSSGGVKNYYVDQIEAIVGTMLLRRAQYELAYKKKDRAKIYIDKVVKDFPAVSVPPELLDQIK
ncbi:MAG: hypothetical protein AMXMBFR49_05060 [Chlorobiota bacterium]|nr:MAG: DUF2723 domain-containing protein [Chlorobiota bacterium]